MDVMTLDEYKDFVTDLMIDNIEEGHETNAKALGHIIRKINYYKFIKENSPGIQTILAQKVLVEKAKDFDIDLKLTYAIPSNA